jgi:hypothetical protein
MLGVGNANPRSDDPTLHHECQSFHHNEKPRVYLLASPVRSRIRPRHDISISRHLGIDPCILFGYD